MCMRLRLAGVENGNDSYAGRRVHNRRPLQSTVDVNLEKQLMATILTLERAVCLLVPLVLL